jgi:regulator of protease activity HflC (stomatin/prohibitin superfamily)
MKKFLLIAASALAVSACGYASVDAGEEGVLIQKPWFFGAGGVVDEPVMPGTTLKAASTDVVKISMTPTAFDMNLGNIMPSNGIPLEFHTTVRMQVTDPVELVKHWNGGLKDKDGNEANYWFYGSIAPIYTNLVRQEIKNYDMVSLAFGGSAVEQAEAHVTERLDAFIKQNKMPVKLLSVTIGRAAPPQEIVDQRTETAAQQQRKLTMDAQTQAEDARRAAELARAQADNAYRSEMQLSPEQFVELKRIEMQQEACKSSTCVFGSGASVLVGK